MSGYLESLSKSELETIAELGRQAQEILDQKSEDHHPDNQKG
ncbi:hypothetical protein [Yersinia ruckeri]|nr:hypothetical protein [Yersinia ruckeri]